MDRYEAAETIAETPLGRLSRAVDRERERDVLLKVLTFPGGLPPEDRELLRRRFVDRTDELRQVQHVHLCRVLDAGHAEAEAWVALEAPTGRPLRDALDSGERFTEDQALGIVGVVCDVGAAVAGQTGLPLGLSPAFIFLSDDGRVHVADADFAVHPADQRVWAHGIAPGESALLAPERLEGAPPSEQSFVFAAGALLHRLTTGRWPYAGTTPVAIRRSIERGLGELSSPAGLPLSDALRQVIRKCLAARQPDRYATIGALTDALLMASRLLTPTEEEAEPEPEQLAALRPEPRRTVWRTRVAVGVGVAAIIAAVATLIAAVGGVFAPPSESPIVALRTPAPGGGESAVGPELLRTVPGAPEPRQPAPRRPARSAPGRGAAPLVSRPQARTAAPRAPSQPAVRYGRISVETWPPDAHPKVYLDEVYAGVAPHIISHVRPGERRLRLVAPGFATWEKAIGVSAGDHVTVIARLTPQRR